MNKQITFTATVRFTQAPASKAIEKVKRDLESKGYQVVKIKEKE